MTLYPLGLGVLFAAEEAAPPVKQLDPASRTGLLLILAGLVAVGLGLMVMTMLWANYLRRAARRREPLRGPDGREQPPRRPE